MNRVRQNPRTGGQELINNSDNDPHMGTTRYFLPALSKSPTPKELINSHLERQKSPQGRERAGGGTREKKKKPRWLEPSGLHAVEMKVEVLILLPWILTAARARAYSTGIPKNSTCLSNHTGPHGALFSLTSF